MLKFPPLELVQIIAPIEATYLRQQQAQIKSVEPSTRTSKRSRGETSIIAPASGAMPAAKETFVNPTITVDLSGGAENVDPTVAPPLSLYAMMQSFMTT